MATGNGKRRPPINHESVRPYRIWVTLRGANGGKQAPGRCYAILKNAHDGAMIEARWDLKETTYEVLNVTNGHWLATYVRKGNDIVIETPRTP